MVPMECGNSLLNHGFVLGVFTMNGGWDWSSPEFRHHPHAHAHTHTHTIRKMSGASKWSGCVDLLVGNSISFYYLGVPHFEKRPVLRGVQKTFPRTSRCFEPRRALFRFDDNGKSISFLILFLDDILMNFGLFCCHVIYIYIHIYIYALSSVLEPRKPELGR